MVRRLDEGLTDLSEIDGRYYEAVMLENLESWNARFWQTAE